MAFSKVLEIELICVEDKDSEFDAMFEIIPPCVVVRSLISVHICENCCVS